MGVYLPVSVLLSLIAIVYYPTSPSVTHLLCLEVGVLTGYLLSQLHSLPSRRSQGFEFPKKGLTREEFEYVVDKKLNYLSNGTKMYNECKGKIICVAKYACIRETKEGNLDKRTLSSNTLREINAVPAAVPGHLSPTQIQKMTSGQRGVQCYDRQVWELYHGYQGELFQLEQLPQGYSRGPKGYLLNENGNEATPEEFCNVIDQLTMVWWRKICAFDRNINVYTEAPHVMERLTKAIKVVILRGVIEIITKNDLLNYRDWNNWRNHVMVVVSFAVYSVVLDTYCHKVAGKCGIINI